MFDLIAGEPRLMPHFHLSLQAGDDLILKRMKRRHSRADAVRTVERIKAARPDATIGADLIAGFPTETEDMALNSLKLLDDCDVIAAHVFPFSPRPDTPAARMPQLPRELVKARAARLREAAAARRDRWLDSLAGSRPCRCSSNPTTRDTATISRRSWSPAPHGARRAAARHRPRRRPSRRRPWHELARPPPRRLHQDRRQGRRQPHRAGRAHQALDTATLDDIEEALIASDLGPEASKRIREAIAARRFEQLDERGLRTILAEEIEAILAPVAKPLEITGFPRPHVILVIGVNGSGKTTTIGKLAHWLKEEDYGVLLAAGDTFRAAAIEQLGIWGDRVGAPGHLRQGRRRRGGHRL